MNEILNSFKRPLDCLGVLLRNCACENKTLNVSYVLALYRANVNFILAETEYNAVLKIWLCMNMNNGKYEASSDIFYRILVIVAIARNTVVLQHR